VKETLAVREPFAKRVSVAGYARAAGASAGAMKSRMATAAGSAARACFKRTFVVFGRERMAWFKVERPPLRVAARVNKPIR